MTNWAQVFTGLLFYAYDGIHQVRTLVFDNYQKCTVPLNPIAHDVRPIKKKKIVFLVWQPERLYSLFVFFVFIFLFSTTVLKLIKIVVQVLEVFFFDFVQKKNFACMINNLRQWQFTRNKKNQERTTLTSARSDSVTCRSQEMAQRTPEWTFYALLRRWP